MPEQVEDGLRSRERSHSPSVLRMMDRGDKCQAQGERGRSGR